MMKKIVAGLLANVDAGKTSLAESLLYNTGTLRKLGRVDHGTAFLDPDQVEKRRGITVFDHVAQLQTNDLKLTLVDTPGHSDFAGQLLQTLGVLDYAILVISAGEGVTSNTRFLWRHLQKAQVPVFIFVNKMDLAGVEKNQVLNQLKEKLNDACVAVDADFEENAATADEDALAQFLEEGSLKEETLQDLIKQRKLFPVFFGSALQNDGVADLLQGLTKWTKPYQESNELQARVFKISHDDKNRLNWLRIFSGELHAKDMLGTEKINELRSYNGTRFETVAAAAGGEVVVATGLNKTYPGQGVGLPATGEKLQPVLNYGVQTQVALDKVWAALQTLADEDPALQVVWTNDKQDISVQLMGELHKQTVEQLLKERFGLDVQLARSGIVYQETINKAGEGIGHFEPLRHYAEVHLWLEPLPAGSGIQFDNKCDQEVLAKNWQQQVLTALQSKTLHGVLIGANLTDVKITLLSGHASIVHSVGGDFREAAWRAVRQGLMELRQQQGCVLLEPYYHFEIILPTDKMGHALTDLKMMGAEVAEPQVSAETSTLTGTAPVAQLDGYGLKLNGYTSGQGSIELTPASSRPCHNAAEVIANSEYDPVKVLADTPNSVFCAHGAGHTVNWADVPSKAHIPPLKK
jgi:ribosomal protection tetracycline resistance protein